MSSVSDIKLIRTDTTLEDNDDVIESFWLYIFSVFPSFVYYYPNIPFFMP